MKILENVQIHFFTEYCTTVTCSFTIDNVVDLATYEGITLAITGDENLASWEKEKSVTFESCYDKSPGTLVIKGSDNEVGGISMLTFLHQSGLLLLSHKF